MDFFLHIVPFLLEKFVEIFLSLPILFIYLNMYIQSDFIHFLKVSLSGKLINEYIILVGKYYIFYRKCILEYLDEFLFFSHNISHKSLQILQKRIFGINVKNILKMNVRYIVIFLFFS